MKRSIIIVTLCVLFPLFAQGQHHIPRTNNVSVSSVHITKIKSDYQKYDAKIGYQHIVEVVPSFDLDWFGKGMTGLNYIGGYRFNNWIFAGVGAGLNFAHRVDKGVKEHVGGSVVLYDSSPSSYSIRNALGLEECNEGSLGRVSVPLYAHLRGYYMRTRWTPYSSISIGGVLASKESGFYLDFSTGVDFRINKSPVKESKHAFVALGFWLRKGIIKGDDYASREECFKHEYDGNNYHSNNDEIIQNELPCGDIRCPLYGLEPDYDHYNLSDLHHDHYYVSDLWNFKGSVIGLSVHVGISF